MPSGAHRYELVRGELHITSPAGGKKRRLGETCAAETEFLLECDSDTVLAPDFAFIEQSRIPESGISDAYWKIPPDLAVEISRPGDTAAKSQASGWHTELVKFGSSIPSSASFRLTARPRLRGG